MSFNSELNDFTEKSVKNAEKIFRGTTIGLFGAIVKRTPVQSGRLKGNWQVDVNKPASGTVGDKDITPVKMLDTKSKLKIQSAIGAASLNDTIYMVNNLPYAKLVENGNYSMQAPSGMIGVSVLEFEREVKRQASKVK